MSIFNAGSGVRLLLLLLQSSTYPPQFPPHIHGKIDKSVGVETRDPTWCRGAVHLCDRLHPILI